MLRAGNEEQLAEVSFGDHNDVFKQPTVINIEHSSDVIIGSVTQFHGPVTILQHQPISTICNGQHDNNRTTINSNKCSLVKSDSTSSENNEPPKACSPDCKRIAKIFTVLFILLVTLILIIALHIENPENADTSDVFTTKPLQTLGDHKLIPREIWGGVPSLKFTRTLKTPVKYALISHTAGNECSSATTCSAILREIQAYHISQNSPDIGYNFLIGGDANIYVGRGWDIVNFQTDGCIAISFIGNYVFNEMTQDMVDATKKLLEQGVLLGKLDKDYHLVAHNQTYPTLSPGRNVYNEIKTFEHFLPGSNISWN